MRAVLAWEQDGVLPALRLGVRGQGLKHRRRRAGRPASAVAIGDDAGRLLLLTRAIATGAACVRERVPATAGTSCCRARKRRTTSASQLRGVVQCPYPRGRSYELDGRLRPRPTLRQADELRAVGRSRCWRCGARCGAGGMSVNVSGGASPLAERPGSLLRAGRELQECAKRASSIAAAAHQYDVSRRTGRCAVENWQRVLHCPLIHPELACVSPPDSGDNRRARRVGRRHDGPRRPSRRRCRCQRRVAVAWRCGGTDVGAAPAGAVPRGVPDTCCSAFFYSYALLLLYFDTLLLLYLTLLLLNTSTLFYFCN